MTADSFTEDTDRNQDFTLTGLKSATVRALTSETLKSSLTVSFLIVFSSARLFRRPLLKPSLHNCRLPTQLLPQSEQELKGPS